MGHGKGSRRLKALRHLLGGCPVPPRGKREEPRREEGPRGRGADVEGRRVRLDSSRSAVAKLMSRAGGS